MYTHMPGYDLLLVNPEKGFKKVARVSVKSRSRAKAEGFNIKSCDSDFVVVVKLNRDSLLTPPEFFVIPTEVLKPLHRDAWGKLSFSAIPDFERYRNGGDRVRAFVGATRRSRAA